MAPERLREGGGASFASDIWSWGLIALEGVLGRRRQLGPGLPNPILYSHARYPMALLAFDIWGLIALEDALSRRRKLGPGLPNPMLCSLATCPMALLAVDIWSWGPHRP